ncbi:MAG: dTMP kinase [Clostridia bacterium]|nr:dTMP kinase [Clostridia bacterium]
MKGKFIAFEGCEGAGKSTQIKLLAAYLDKSDVPYVVTREPGGSVIAEKIRNLVLDGKNKNMSDECEALLYAAAREQHLSDIIIPALNAGKTVICDRYVHSSLAYQGYARGLGLEYVRAINFRVMLDYMPDLTLFLDIAPDDAFSRKHGADKDDRMEQQGLEFHRRVYEGYKLCLKSDKNFCAVDCRGNKEQTHANIIRLLKDKGIIN